MSVVENFLEIKSHVKTAGGKFGLKDINHMPEIIAVSKNQPLEKIIPLLEHGHRIFGENRVQEASSKWSDLRKKYKDIELHLIGPLQTNKVKDALQIFDVIQTVDRPKLADELAKEIAKNHDIRTREFFIQVNIGEEEQKSGIGPKDTKNFINYCVSEKELPVAGLMCIPPIDDEPSPYFALLAKLAKNSGLKFLSMGMSNDYEVAAMMGATHVRIGTAIFGERVV